MGCTKEASLCSLLVSKRMWFKISTCWLLFSDLAIADWLGYLEWRIIGMENYRCTIQMCLLATFTKAKSK